MNSIVKQHRKRAAAWLQPDAYPQKSRALASLLGWRLGHHLPLGCTVAAKLKRLSIRFIARFVSLAVILLACSACSQQSYTAQNVQAEPEGYRFIVSGPESYWRSQPVFAAQGAPEVVVDTDQRFQMWHGTGGTFNELGWQALQALSASDRDKILALLFDPKDGIGFTWGRIPMGASDFAIDRYTLNSAVGDVAMTHFSIERDKKYLIPYIQAAQRASKKIKFWGSPWTPPPWMKDNNSFDRGAFNPKYFQSYAQYFVQWIQAYQGLNIPIDHVQPQNEPGWSQDYPSCAWGPSGGNDNLEVRPVNLGHFVKAYLAPALEQSNLDTELWYGTLSNSLHFDAYWNDLLPEGLPLIRGVGLQWGTDKYVKKIANTLGKYDKKLLVMQTEHKCGNYPWMQNKTQDVKQADRYTFLSTMAPNNHSYAEESWELIKQWVEQGVNIYSAWNMVLDNKGFNMDTVRPWPQNALIVVDPASQSYRITPTYYVFRHFGQYLQEGAQRVAVSGANGLAFVNPDASIVLTLFNEQNTETPLSVNIGGETLTLRVPARGWGTLLKY